MIGDQLAKLQAVEELRHAHVHVRADAIVEAPHAERLDVDRLLATQALRREKRAQRGLRPSRSGGSQLVEGPLQALSCEPGLKIYDDIYEAGVFGGMV